MPLPFIIGGIALVAGVTGAGTGISGGMKMKKASDRTQEAKKKQEAAIEKFNRKNDSTTKLMDSLGKQELEIMQSFSDFSDVIEKIQGRPEFKNLEIEGIDLPEYEAEDLKKISVAAGTVLGGAIFNATGQHLSDKADEAFKQAEETERQVKEVVQYLNILTYCAEKFQNALTEVEKECRKRLDVISRMVNNIFYPKTNWSDFTEEEKKTTENLVLLTGILYKMCRVNLVTKSEDERQLNSVNYKQIDAVVADADKALTVVRAA